MSKARFLCLSFLLLACYATTLTAAVYVVPPDRFEIERSHTIVIGRVLGSHVERTPEYGIETVTDVAIEEALKGKTGFVIQVREPGGRIGDEAKLVLGAPSFIDGDRVLLLLFVRDDGAFLVNDLELGSFRYDRDTLGRELLVRAPALEAPNDDGTPHAGQRRTADGFVQYIRGVVRGESVQEDYFVPAAPLAPRIGSESAHLVGGNATFTANSYLSDIDGAGENGLGSRWNGGTQAWNQGNTETGAPGNGTTAITTAFNGWNGGGAHYSLSSSNANNNGILDASDHVNNIVFEKNLSGAGAGPYNCASGGVLGIGGITAASGAQHTFHGENFFTTLEGDVSMNQGIAGCTTLFNSGDFTTAVTHEVGHTLGFRHADGNRINGSAGGTCSSDPNLDCSSGAVMKAVIVHGLGGSLQGWDSSAVQTVYGAGPVCTPPSISVQPASVSITQGNSTILSVTAAGSTPLSYQWYIGTAPSTTTPTGTNSNQLSVSPTTNTSYWVRVTGQCAPTADSTTATVTVTCGPPQITQQPASTSITAGAQTTLSVVATGTPTLSYQWYIGTAPSTTTPTGTNSSQLTVQPTTTTSYWVKVTGQCGSPANSNTATVSVQQCVPPQIVNDVQDQTIISGNTASLTVGFVGTSPTVTWYRGTAPDKSSQVGSGQTIQVGPLTTTTNFWAQIVNGCGSVNTRTATVTVTATCTAPQISSAGATPSSITVGQSTTLNVVATGTSLQFQWFKGQSGDTSNPISGANTSTLVDSPTVNTNYWVRVTSGCGTGVANSATIPVTVTTCTPPTITTQPVAVTIPAGTNTTLTVAATGNGLHYAWFKGEVDDTSTPVGTDSPTLNTGVLQTTTKFWVRVTNDCSGIAKSNSVTVTVAKERRRGARH